MAAFDDDRVVRHVLVLIAMEAEAAPFISGQHLVAVTNEFKQSPCHMFTSADTSNGQISVVLNGKCAEHGVDNVGTVPAVLSTFLAVNQLKPDLVINAGTCGGFKSKGSEICDAYISTQTKNHDRRIPIPGFDAYGINSLQSVNCPNLVSALGLKTGVVTTGNSLDHTEMDDKVMSENDASCKDMEAAAIAWAASLTSTPFFAVKVVTDIVDGERPSHDEFLENLSAAAAKLQTVLPQIISFVLGKKLTEL